MGHSGLWWSSSHWRPVLPILLSTIILLLPLPVLSSLLFHVFKTMFCLIQRRTVAIRIAKNMIRFWYFLFCSLHKCVTLALGIHKALLLLMLILTREWEDLCAVKPLCYKHGKAARKPICNSRQVINSSLQNHTLNRNSLVLFITVLCYIDSGFHVPDVYSICFVTSLGS